MIPQTMAEVTGSWLRGQLGNDERFEGARWSEIETQQIGQGFGLDGTLVLVQVPGSATASLITKLCDYTPNHNEPNFYRRIAPEMPIRLPLCYGIADDNDGRCVILLEDLTEATQGDCLVGATDAQTEALVATLASYHARFWGGGDPVVADRRRFTFRSETALDDFDSRCARLLDRYRVEAGPSAEAILASLPERRKAAVELFAAETPTLVHADLHLDNVLFIDTEPVILDWPGAALGPGALDLGRVLIEGMTLDQRRARQARLTSMYRDVLSSQGAPAPSEQQLGQQLGAVCVWICCWAVGWAGSEDPGLDRPRVPELLSSLVRNSFGAASDNWLQSS